MLFTMIEDYLFGSLSVGVVGGTEGGGDDIVIERVTARLASMRITIWFRCKSNRTRLADRNFIFYILG